MYKYTNDKAYGNYSEYLAYMTEPSGGAWDVRTKFCCLVCADRSDNLDMHDQIVRGSKGRPGLASHSKILRFGVCEPIRTILDIFL